MPAKKPYLSQVNCVVSYALDKKIRYRVGEIEQAFGSIVSGQAHSTNITDEMPAPLARFTLNSGPKSIAVSQVSAQLAMSFGNDKSFDDAFKVISKNISMFWSAVSSFKTPSELKELGVIATVNVPSAKSSEELAKDIFDRFFKMEPLGEIAASGIQVGFLDSDKSLFRNIAVAPYQVHAGMVEAKQDQNVLSIDISSLPIEERGYEVKLDVNSRPMKDKGMDLPAKLVDVVLSELEEMLFRDPVKVLTW